MLKRPLSVWITFFRMQAQTSYQPPPIAKEAAMIVRKEQCALCYSSCQLKL